MKGESGVVVVERGRERGGRGRGRGEETGRRDQHSFFLRMCAP